MQCTTKYSHLPDFAVFLFSGSSPEYSKGTYIPVFPTKDRQSSWGGRITETNGQLVTMGVTPVADCIVGKYQMFVAVLTPFGVRRTKRDRSRDLYILFNPWLAGLCTVQKSINFTWFRNAELVIFLH